MTINAMEMTKKFIRVYLNDTFKNTQPTEIQFQDAVNKVYESTKLIFSISESELQQIVNELRSEIAIIMPPGTVVTLGDHKPWLEDRKPSIEFYYWNRYKRYLEEHKGWNNNIITTLDSNTDKIVDLLGDPDISNNVSFARKGLVIGDVQSGKTANFTAVCNKAADVGYKVIIVLSGTIETLRVQTQARLDEELVGILSKNQLKLKKNEAISSAHAGVGNIDKNKRLQPFTSTRYDFNANIVNSNSLTIKALTEPAIFVVKKNKSILENLIKWLAENNADESGTIDQPLLLIDDEADNASINTRDPEKDPTEINAKIRKILGLFHKSAYLGITATPYANIFIDPDSDDEMLSNDLFPKDFIYNLSPPSNYIGADSIFFEESEYRNSLVEINEMEYRKYLPDKHKKDMAINGLPSCLYDSIVYFFLVNVIRDIRGDVASHRSMLINITHIVSLQEEISRYVQDYVNLFKSEIKNYSYLKREERNKLTSFSRLESIWNRFELEVEAGVELDVVIDKYLYDSISEVQIVTVNSRASGLNYLENGTNGIRVIAVGGYSLSRGLTLEGLVVSYFYRTSQMYDTLLQMGRWFGYRPGYERLFKIWMPNNIMAGYSFIAEATNELKNSVGEMNKLGLTPRDFGLKVRQDPDGLMITARNKMRTAQTINRPISVTGRLIETPRLFTDRNKLDENEKLVRNLVSTLDGGINHRKGTLFRSVKKDVVVELVNSFNSHQWNLSFRGDAIAKMIADSTELKDWDVFIPSGSSQKSVVLDVSNNSIKVNPQRRIVLRNDDMLKIEGNNVRIASGDVAKAGISEEEAKLAEEKYIFSNRGSKHVPVSAYLDMDRNPLLIIHLIEPEDPENLSNYDYPEVLYGIGLGFPGTKNIEMATYKINLTELKKSYEFPEEVDVDEL